MPKAKKKCRTMSITEYLDNDDLQMVGEIVADALQHDKFLEMQKGSGSINWDITVEVCDK